MAWTVELCADYRGPRGRVVTDLHRHRVASMPAALAIVAARWRTVSRRRGTQMHVRYTADNGQTLTQCYRQA
jgi:hypothetical protein